MSKSTKHVLIVEDERPLARALELKLQHENYETTYASNGHECLEALEKNEFDVILLDLMMPEIDGFQVLERLQKSPKKHTVFVLSNLSQREDEERVMALGTTKYFIKSNTSLAEIVSAVESA